MVVARDGRELHAGQRRALPLRTAGALDLWLDTCQVNVGSAERAAALYAGLKQRGILVRYWGKRPELADKLRITVGPL